MTDSFAGTMALAFQLTGIPKALIILMGIIIKKSSRGRVIKRYPNLHYILLLKYLCPIKNANRWIYIAPIDINAGKI